MLTPELKRQQRIYVAAYELLQDAEHGIWETVIPALLDRNREFKLSDIIAHDEKTTVGKQFISIAEKQDSESSDDALITLYALHVIEARESNNSVPSFMSNIYNNEIGTIQMRVKLIESMWEAECDPRNTELNLPETAVIEQLERTLSEFLLEMMPCMRIDPASAPAPEFHDDATLSMQTSVSRSRTSSTAISTHSSAVTPSQQMEDSTSGTWSEYSSRSQTPSTFYPAFESHQLPPPNLRVRILTEIEDYDPSKDPRAIFRSTRHQRRDLFR